MLLATIHYPILSPKTVWADYEPHAHSISWPVLALGAGAEGMGSPWCLFPLSFLRHVSHLHLWVTCCMQTVCSGPWHPCCMLMRLPSSPGVSPFQLADCEGPRDLCWPQTALGEEDSPEAEPMRQALLWWPWPWFFQEGSQIPTSLLLQRLPDMSLCQRLFQCWESLIPAAVALSQASSCDSHLPSYPPTHPLPHRSQRIHHPGQSLLCSKPFHGSPLPSAEVRAPELGTSVSSPASFPFMHVGFQLPVLPTHVIPFHFWLFSWAAPDTQNVFPFSAPVRPHLSSRASSLDLSSQ